MTEQWKSVPGFESLYEVSDLGSVRSLVKRNTKWRGAISPVVRSDGYLQVALYGTDGRPRVKLNEVAASMKLVVTTK